MSRRSRILAPLPLAAMLAVAIAGCASRRPATRATTVWPTGQQCLAMLRARGAELAGWTAPRGGGCGVDTPLTLVRAGSRLDPPVGTSCGMALAWASFEPRIQQLAMRELGSRVVAVRHFGSYACRAMTSGSGRASLHATARAFDVHGFVLADGRDIEVEEAWSAWGAEGRFIRAVAAAACAHFSATLTPETDRLHANHLHLDIGPWHVCGI
jgi:hypothetical protein